MSTDMTDSNIRWYMRKTKRELIDIYSRDRVNLYDKLIKKDQIIQSAAEENKDLSELFREESKKVEALNKDLSIMQQALNDVEEKNRALNVQLLDLRKALKTTSQYL